MFERFTDRARKVMLLANQEAQRFNHEYLGTEHLLLGLMKEGSGVGAMVLTNLDVDTNKLRLEVEKLVKSGPDMVTMGKLPQTPAAKRVIEYAIQEARALNHSHVGTEHILLGLLRESEGVAAQVLMNLGLKLEDVRQEVISVLGAGVEEEPAGSCPLRSDTAARGGQEPEAADYRSLRAWQKADELAQQVYGLTGQCPKEEIAGVATRLRDMALSIPPHIAEAHSRESPGEAKWFLNSALASLRGLRYLLDFAGRRNCLQAEDCARLAGLANELDRLLRILYRNLSER